MSGSAASALGACGLRRLGQLDALSVEDLSWLGGLSDVGAESLERTLRGVAELGPPSEVLAAWNDIQGDGGEAALPLAVAYALARASSLGEELRALVAHLSPRDAAVLLTRWGLDPRYPSLARAAAELGICAERARQIAVTYEARLRRLSIRLPTASRVVELMAEAGPLHTEELLDVLRREGVTAGVLGLKTLARLGWDWPGLGRPIEHVPEVDLWVLPSVEELWSSRRAGWTGWY